MVPLLDAPESGLADNLDRKMRHSVNLMTMCTAHTKFTYEQAGFPGSVHDSRVFRFTSIFSGMVTDTRSWFPFDNYHIVGYTELL